jgi:hypothetical protein
MKGSEEFDTPEDQEQRKSAVTVGSNNPMFSR